MDTNYAFAYTYVSYDLPSDEYYNYLKLKEGVRENCSIVSSPEWDDFKPSMSNIIPAPISYIQKTMGLIMLLPIILFLEKPKRSDNR